MEPSYDRLNHAMQQMQRFATLQKTPADSGHSSLGPFISYGFGPGRDVAPATDASASPVERSLGAWNRVAVSRVRADGLPQRFCQGLEDRLGDVVVVGAVR